MQTQLRYMKIKIIDIFESEGLLRVKTECEYGFDDLGLNLESKKINALTGIPKWQQEVKELLEKKYKNAVPVKDKPLKKYIGDELEI